MVFEVLETSVIKYIFSFRVLSIIISSKFIFKNTPARNSILCMVSVSKEYEFLPIKCIAKKEYTRILRYVLIVTTLSCISLLRLLHHKGRCVCPLICYLLRVLLSKDRKRLFQRYHDTSRCLGLYHGM